MRRAANDGESRIALEALAVALRQTARALERLERPLLRWQLALETVQTSGSARGAMELQCEYDAWRDREGLNPTPKQREMLEVRWIQLALLTGEMVP